MHFIGNLNQEDASLVELYNSAVALVHASFYEGWCATPLEAMACGTAVVASDIPPVREVVQDAAILAPPDDLDAWKDAMVRIVGDEGHRSVLSREGPVACQTTHMEEGGKAPAPRVDDRPGDGTLRMIHPEGIMKKRVDYRDVFAGEPCSVVALKSRKTAENVEVASFVPGRHYAGNFGKQWARFRDIQLDSVNGTAISKSYLEQLTGSPVELLEGKTVMEVGAGAGRFTEYFIRHAKLVVAVDLSEAIFVNAALGASNLVPVQANLLEMPPMKMRFDMVYCRGVLQHTPDPVRSISQLHQWVKPGGTVVFDIYAPGSLGKPGAKYVLRPIIQRLFTYESFSSFLERYAAPILRLRWNLKSLLPGKTRKLLDFVLPVYDYRHVHPLTDAQLVEWGKPEHPGCIFRSLRQPDDIGRSAGCAAGNGSARSFRRSPAEFLSNHSARRPR
ncbi:MAG: glycosyltransferase [Desulfobacterales bacterium]|nr:glycosyltransferase [Desulfobacterales bacterium]